MITWMQKHKKWLIVTIWISTIAFVGAGFVGWGSYDYGKSDSAVAVVGKKEVPLKDLQNEYNTLYSQYQQMLGDSFNQELAEQFKLEDEALQRVIQKYLLLNYADDLGLMTTDLEVAQELVTMNSFFKNGKFDKNTYILVLKQNRRTAASFEAQLKQDLLVQKIQKIFTLELSKNEIKNLNGLLFGKDKVSIKVIDGKNIKIASTAKDLLAYWEVNKEMYKSPNGYKINYTKIDNIGTKTKKEMKKVALKQYLNLKKNKEEFKETKTIFDNSNFLSTEDLKKLLESNKNEVLKPMYKDNNYYVIKLLEKVAPQTLPYDDVKSQIEISYITEQKSKKLDELAQKSIKNFSGTNIGYINRESTPTIQGLGAEDTAKLVQNIFASTEKTSYIKLGSKAVVYQIEDSLLANYNEANDETVKTAMQNIKANSISSAFIEQLKLRYDVKTYLKSN